MNRNSLIIGMGVLVILGLTIYGYAQTSEPQDGFEALQVEEIKRDATRDFYCVAPPFSPETMTMSDLPQSTKETICLSKLYIYTANP